MNPSEVVGLFVDDCKTDIKLLKYKVKKFYENRLTEPLDKQINDFVDKENVQIVDVKYTANDGCHFALLIYRKYEKVEVLNEKKL